MLGTLFVATAVASSNLSMEAIAAWVIGVGGLTFSFEQFMRNRREVAEKYAAMNALEAKSLTELERRIQLLDDSLGELRRQHLYIVESLAELKGEIKYYATAVAKSKE